jgi:hypothetical protein
LTTFDILWKTPSNELEHLFLNSELPRADFVRKIYDLQYKKPTPITPQVVDPLSVLCLFNHDIITEGYYSAMKIHVKGKRTRGCSTIGHRTSNKKEQTVYIVTGLNTKLIND